MATVRTPRATTRRPSRGKVASVRFDEVEYRRVANRASAMGVPVSALVRASVLDNVEGEHVPTRIAAAIPSTTASSDSRELVELRTAINKLGGNVNQLARIANQRGVVVAGAGDDPGEVASLLRDVQEVLRMTQDLLGGVAHPDAAKLAMLRGTMGVDPEPVEEPVTAPVVAVVEEATQEPVEVAQEPQEAPQVVREPAGGISAEEARQRDAEARRVAAEQRAEQQAAFARQQAEMRALTAAVRRR